ncbi:hypothetical protein C8R47DRAFT_1150524 [Mycena vitilis]|nr:hypothetical protein C8R47DRAFT_1150524 [Mycena vitilis]
MASSAANQVPYEIISEIISPLLKHSDEAFSDRSEKAFLEPPSYSSSTYLLVCKAWLRVATPLLYNVVILRTTAQAEALQGALKSSPEMGLLVKKLRVEGGFGTAMQAILKSAPNITDLFLTLSIWGSDNVRGLCGGLQFINPRRVILVDPTPKKNKQVQQLSDTLVKNISKWDKLEIFDFPYDVHATMSPPHVVARAGDLAAALAMSKSLETFLFNSPGNLPTYLRRLREAPSLKAIHYKNWMPDRTAKELRNQVKDDPKLQALLTFNIDAPGYVLRRREPADSDGSSSDDDSPSDSSSRSVSLAPVQTSSRDFRVDVQRTTANRVHVENLGELKQVGATRGKTLQYLAMSRPQIAWGPGSKKPLPAEDPGLLAPFTALAELCWDMGDERVRFGAPPPGYSAFPNLQVLKIGCSSPSVLDIGVNLPCVPAV